MIPGPGVSRVEDLNLSLRIRVRLVCPSPKRLVPSAPPPEGIRQLSARIDRLSFYGI